MIRFKTIFVFICFFLVIGCQKRKYPEDVVQMGAEEIFFIGYVGAEQIVLKAGTNAYYCYSSYDQPPDSIYVFQAELKKYDCNPCPLALGLELYDYRPRPLGSSVDIDSSFRKGMREIITGLSKPSTLRFESHANKEILSIRWDVSGGGSSYDSIFTYEFLQPGPQTVSLTLQTKGNCKSTVFSRIFVGNDNSIFACSIEAKSVQNNSAQYGVSIIGGKAPYTYRWNFGDGNTSSLSNPTHNYTYSGSYPVNLQIEDADHKVCEANYIHITGNDISSCAANMSIFYKSNRTANLNGAKIRWTDQNNQVFRSDNISQPAETYFEVLNSQEYKANERGEAGRLLTLRFNVLLSDGSRQLWFKSENAVIAVSYK